jgi:hypothetical protein
MNPKFETLVCATSDFSLELWSFQVLALPWIGNAAERAAAQADFVILSMHGKSQLSSD